MTGPWAYDKSVIPPLIPETQMMRLFVTEMAAATLLFFHFFPPPPPPSTHPLPFPLSSCQMDVWSWGIHRKRDSHILRHKVKKTFWKNFFFFRKKPLKLCFLSDTNKTKQNSFPWFLSFRSQMGKKNYIYTKMFGVGSLETTMLWIKWCWLMLDGWYPAVIPDTLGVRQFLNSRSAWTT